MWNCVEPVFIHISRFGKFIGARVCFARRISLFGVYVAVKKQVIVIRTPTIDTFSCSLVCTKTTERIFQKLRIVSLFFGFECNRSIVFFVFFCVVFFVGNAVIFTSNNT